jgi:Na+-translocating ferredoxin:NAD+ oxidoreductase subunit C
MPLFSFRGGVHPPEHKHLSEDAAIETLSPPETVIVPLSQHLGVPADACVARGDSVLRGQKIGEPHGFVSAAVHASVSGKVKSIGPVAIAGSATCEGITIEADGNDTVSEECKACKGEAKETILQAITSAGIVGMGGATFPSHVKLQPPAEAPISLLIINAAECEPFLTCDDRLMREEGQTVLRGVYLLMHALAVEKCIIAIEANKPAAIERMRECADVYAGIEVQELKTRYPQGGEKQLIYALTGKEVPSGGLPMHVGCVVHNVGTAAAVAEAYDTGIPLIERIVTVSGDAVSRPGNFRVRIGTPIRNLLDAAGCDYDILAKVILGGPMTGKAQTDIDVPVVKGTSGVLAWTRKWVDTHAPEPCIRCGRCLSVCPAGLEPTQLESMTMAHDTDGLKKNHAMDCIECGCCAYTCPARRPLVHALRYGKTQLAALRKIKKKKE